MEKTVGGFEAKVEVHRALTIKEILEHILEFCPLRDLKQCRLVSTFWRESSIKAFKSSPIGLTSTSKTREFVRFLKDPRPPAGSRAQLYASFILSNTSLKLSSQSAAFWTISGSHIKHLELSNIKLENVDELRNIVLNLCSNLKDLILRKVSLGVPPINNVVEPKEWQAPQFGENKSVKSLIIDQVPRSLGISWMELVTYFPSLKILQLEEARNYHQRLFEAILLTRQHDPTTLVLTEIHFSLAEEVYGGIYQDYPNLLAIKIVEMLSKTNLQLQALSIDLSGLLTVNSFILGDFLESQGSSLQKLSIHRKTGDSFDPIILHHVYNIAPLENLQELELKSSVFTSMWIVKLFPNLRKLSFFEHNFNADERFTMETDLRGVQLTKCVELKVNCELYDMSMEKMELLVNLFPNVERLKIPLNNDMFSLVCQRWPKLMELDIHDSEVDDSGITGMDEEDVGRINGQRSELNGRPFTVPRANITDLKHLQKLTMCLHMYPLDYKFLGFCGKLYGFGGTPNLEELCIISYKYDKKAYKELFVGNRKINLSIL